jgi:ABC-type dipeptide/oligopeptide/nickel transport system ATPase component
MIRARYNKDREYDEILEKTTDYIKSEIKSKDDDFLLMVVGATGTGKSMLVLHIMERYLNSEASINYLALNKNDFATALYSAKEKKGFKMCVNDEANISKRDSLTKYNKEVIDLYMSIRGLNIFHVWCNPSVDMIDKHFIEERINGLIYVRTKDINRPRLYYFFPKKNLLKLWEKEKNLKMETLNKHRKTFSSYVGWFRDYKGCLREPYLKKKDNRMTEKVDYFYEKYGKKLEQEKIYNVRQVAKMLDMPNSHSLREKVKQLLSKNELDHTQVSRSASGRFAFTPDSIEIIKKSYEDSMKKTWSALNGKK